MNCHYLFITVSCWSVENTLRVRLIAPRPTLGSSKELRLPDRRPGTLSPVSLKAALAEGVWRCTSGWRGGRGLSLTGWRKMKCDSNVHNEHILSRLPSVISRATGSLILYCILLCPLNGLLWASNTLVKISLTVFVVLQNSRTTEFVILKPQFLSSHIKPLMKYVKRSRRMWLI